MLHITDIEKRLKDNPEPDFVKEVRHNIIQSFSRLQFVEQGHKYYVHNDDGTQTELPSVSYVCHQFEEEADWDAIAANKAKKEGVPVEELKRKWRETNLKSTSNGTRTHLFGESYMYFFRGKTDLIPSAIKETQYEDGFLIPYGKKEEAIASFYEDAYSVKNFYPVMAEAQIYTGVNGSLNLKQNYSGTFDMLFAYQMRGKWKLAIFDWKTNKDLENSYNRQFGRSLLDPFGYLVEEPRSLYTLQLSAYQLGIQQLGYEVVDRKIVWLKDDATYEKIQTEDLTKDLIKALS
jgi:hypothetical protein